MLQSLSAPALLPLVSRAEAQSTSSAGSGAAAIHCWLQSSLDRVFPNSPAGKASTCNLLGARNQKLSFQVCVRNQTTKAIKVRCEVNGPSDIQLQVRRVGYVRLPHHTNNVPASDTDGLGNIPGLVPDPLFPEQTTQLGPWETQSFWITVAIPADATPGQKSLRVRMTQDQGKKKEPVSLAGLQAHLDVRSLTVKPRRNFPVCHWWHADAIYDAYKIEPFGERWWQLLDAHLANLKAHGSDVIMLPLYDNRKQRVPDPPQLLGISEPAPGRYEFDWRPIHRFVEVAKRNGMEYFEIPHLWLYWQVKHPVYIYKQEGGRYIPLWPSDAPATTGPYKTFLEQFLPSLHSFLKREEILDHTFIHVSDEPGGEVVANYRAARALLEELAPWTKGKILDALSDIRYGKEGLVEHPVVLLPSAEAYRKAGIPHWVYFCTGPRGKYLNRFFDTPLAKTRMAGFLFYRLKAKGFLHWGYDYWFKMDTHEVPDLYWEGSSDAWPGIAYGDPFVVYPGPDGPLDSIRWEVFSEALGDYALLQTMGISPDSPLLASIHNFADFPKTEDWIERTRSKLLKS